MPFPNPIRRNLDYNERQKKLDELKRKHRHRKKMALYEAFLNATALTDPMAGQITVQPYPPAEPSPIGMTDGLYPNEDFESKPDGSPMYYGILETHMADDGTQDTEEPTYSFTVLILLPGGKTSEHTLRFSTRALAESVRKRALRDPAIYASHIREEKPPK